MIKNTSRYFFVLFVLLLLSLFTLELLNVTQNHIIIPWTHFLAEMSSYIVRLFDTHAIANGVVLRDAQSGFAVSIQPGCNGIEAIIVLIAAMLAYPASIKAKVISFANHQGVSPLEPPKKEPNHSNKQIIKSCVAPQALTTAP